MKYCIFYSTYILISSTKTSLLKTTTWRKTATHFILLHTIKIEIYSESLLLLSYLFIISTVYNTDLSQWSGHLNSLSGFTSTNLFTQVADRFLIWLSLAVKTVWTSLSECYVTTIVVNTCSTRCRTNHLPPDWQSSVLPTELSGGQTYNWFLFRKRV